MRIRAQVEGLRSRVPTAREGNPNALQVDDSLSCKKLGMPRETVQRYLDRGIIVFTKNVVKPLLTPKIKTDHVAYCESFVEDDGCFFDLLDVVMLDK